MAFHAFVHLASFLALSLSPPNSLVSSRCDHSRAYASFLALTVSNSSLFTPALLRTHSFVFFAVHETRRILLSPFISKASRRVSEMGSNNSLTKRGSLQRDFTPAHCNIQRLYAEVGVQRRCSPLENYFGYLLYCVTQNVCL